MTINWRGKLILLTGATLIAAGLFVIFIGPGAGAARVPAARLAAAAAPASRSGDNGTVKIHNSATPVADPRNEPHVCVFYLDAFGFDAGQAVAWWIQAWPPAGNRAVVAAGTLATDGSGDGHTGDMTLPDGHYKLFWTFAGEHGRAKHKVFTCDPPWTGTHRIIVFGSLYAQVRRPGS